MRENPNLKNCLLFSMLDSVGRGSVVRLEVELGRCHVVLKEKNVTKFFDNENGFILMDYIKWVNQNNTSIGNNFYFFPDN